MSKPVPERQKLLDFKEARDDGVAVISAKTTCRSSALCYRQMTTPAAHHSIFTELTVLKH